MIAVHRCCRREHSEESPPLRKDFCHPPQYEKNLIITVYPSLLYGHLSEVDAEVDAEPTAALESNTLGSWRISGPET